ncbi:MAG: hypothetical protein WCA13_08250 [Terriglobales bacterium]
MKGKPILAFDTSALNHLADDGNRDLRIAAIQSGYELRLPELATGEIYATPEFSRRKDLYEVCRKLLNNGCCISPPHWLISRLAKCHHGDPITFDWSNVPWRIRADEEQICASTILDDERLATSQLENQKNSKKDFKAGFRRGAGGLGTWKDWIEHQEQNGGLLAVATNLYQRALSYDQETGCLSVDQKVELGEEESGKFVNSCPPFRALVYAYAMTAYDRGCTQRPSGEPIYNAGRNDQLMSVYLPYCDIFITGDPAEERCLREIARAAKVATEVWSYTDFRVRVCPET